MINDNTASGFLRFTSIYDHQDFRKINRYINLFFCFVFLPMIITIAPLGTWITYYPDFAIIITLFLYFIYFSLKIFNFPQKFIGHRYLDMTIFTIFIVVMTYAVAKYPFPASIEEISSPAEMARLMRLRYRTVWLISLVVMGYSLSVSLLEELFRQILIKRDLEEKQRNAQLSLYKAQINPHFFFNTMNTLYGLIISKSDKTEDAFVKFSELLKYSYSKIDRDFITINEEVEYIMSYIDLQKLRLNNHTEIETEINIEDESVKIPPMLLISFIENSFKYGSSSKRDCNIYISLKVVEHELSFKCENDIIVFPDIKEEEAIGIENTRARLNILYGKNQTLEVQNDGRRYKVKLKILLNET